MIPFILLGSIVLFLLLSPPKKEEKKKTPEQELGEAIAKYLSNTNKAAKS